MEQHNANKFHALQDMELSEEEDVAGDYDDELDEEIWILTRFTGFISSKNMHTEVA